jgi:N-hydroxyarylamine O-acetyltransferase
VSDPLGPVSDPLGPGFVAAYLARLGLAGPPATDPPGLRELHAAHLGRVPFENLSIHLGEPVSLDPPALADKVLRRGRGGFCYELNGLFAELLIRLGFGVTRRAARVWSGTRFGPPLDHLALAVTTPGSGPGSGWLVDVGFGAHSLYPLRIDPGVEQADPAGRFRVEAPGGGDLDVVKDGTVQYRVEDHPRDLADFDAMCWYQCSSPESHFTRTVVCTLQTGSGRVTLSGDRLIRTDGSTRTETHLPDDPAVLDAYRTVFGLDLDRVPRIGGAGGSDRPG